MHTESFNQFTNDDMGKVYKLKPNEAFWCVDIQMSVKFTDDELYVVLENYFQGEGFFGHIVKSNINGPFICCEIEGSIRQLDTEYFKDINAFNKIKSPFTYIDFPHLGEQLDVFDKFPKLSYDEALAIFDTAISVFEKDETAGKTEWLRNVSNFTGAEHTIQELKQLSLNPNLEVIFTNNNFENFMYFCIKRNEIFYNNEIFQELIHIWQEDFDLLS